MDFEAYKRSGRKRYEKLAKTVKKMLEDYLSKNPNYHYLVVQERAKEFDSLQQKLQEDEKLNSKNIENHIKDLAGCRIIFYTNNDVNRFMWSFFSNELFDIHRKSKLHHPDPNETKVKFLFRSCNYVVSLKPEQINKPKYLKGMLCEIQVQTVLDHAWANTAHDTIYKEPKQQDFGRRKREKNAKLMKDAMRCLARAGYIFQMVESNMQRIEKVKDLFDANALDEALETGEIDKLSTALAELDNEILPNHNDSPAIFLEMREKLKKSWILLEKATNALGETESGISVEKLKICQISGHICSIINDYRYIYPDETYIFLRDLYLQTSHEWLRAQLIDLAKSLAKNDYEVWQYFGPEIQVILADLLKQEKDITPIAPLVIEISNEILNPKIKSEKFEFDKFSLGEVSVLYSKEFENTRKTVIDIISSYAANVTEDDEKMKEAILPLFASIYSQYPIDNPKTTVMIFSDFTYVLDKLSVLAPKSSYGVKHEIERKLFQCWRDNKKLWHSLTSSVDVVKKHKIFMKKIMLLRDTLNSDEEFVIFKTIVGHDSVFSYQWDEQETYIDRIEEKRHKFCYEQQDKLIDSIAPKNWRIWQERLMLPNVESGDIGSNSHYVRFLCAISERKPDFGYELLQDETLPNIMLFHLAERLFNGKLQNKVKTLLNRWLDEDKFTDVTANVVEFIQNIEPAFTLKVARRAIVDKREYACIRCAIAAIRNYPYDQEFWRDEVFFPCLKIIRQSTSHKWIEDIAFADGKDLFFSNLTIEQSKIVLESILRVNDVGYHVEQILEPIANKYPQVVLNWFGDRIELSMKEELECFKDIPLSFERLHKVLQPYPQDIIAFVRKWINHGDWLAKEQVTKFLSRVYSEFEDSLQEYLLDLITYADTTELQFIVEILQKFHCQAKMLPVLRAVIVSDASNRDIEDYMLGVFHISGAHKSSDVVSIYQERIEWLESWGKDNNIRVSEFAERVIRNLENKKASFNRTRAADITMMRLCYDESFEEKSAEENKTFTENNSSNKPS